MIIKNKLLHLFKKNNNFHILMQKNIKLYSQYNSI